MNLDDQLPPQTRIGHVHLKVSDLERSINFYTQYLGFELTTRMGANAAFLSVGEYHHHIGLNTWESRGGTAPAAGTTGLYHFAILLPDRKSLAQAIRRLQQRDWPIEGAADHGVSEAVYLSDPDSNGIELYVDRPKNQWPQSKDGRLDMYTRPLDFDELMKLAD